MNVNEKQIAAAKKVVNVAKLLKLAIRHAEQCDLTVQVNHYNPGEGSEVAAVVRLREDKVVAQTEEGSSGRRGARHGSM
jgi:hypothetical protein